MNSLIRRRSKKKFSSQEWARELADIRQKLDRLTLFEDLKTSAERTRECATDFTLFCHTYFPHYFRASTNPEGYEETLALAQTEEVPGIDVEPRGWAKSTRITFAFTLWCILYERKRFAVLCSETYEKAEMAVWRVLLELQYNRRVINDFGNLVAKDAARGDFTTILTGERKTTTRVLAMGAGQSARGLLNGEFRPDLFIGDDLESRELARNPKRVAKLVELILSDYLGAMCAEHWTFLIIGTIICQGSAMDVLMENEYFNRVKHRAIEINEDGSERSTWEELHPIKKLQLLRQTMGLTKFQAEKQNEPMEEEGRFRQSWFGFWNSLPVGFDLRNLVMQVDPSYSATGDNKAIAVGGRYAHTNLAKDFAAWRLTSGVPLPEGDYTLVTELFNRKCSIDEMIVQIYAMYERWKPVMIYIDGTYAQKIIFQREFGRYEATRGRLPIKYIELQESKHERIIALEGPIERKLVLFPRPDSQDVKNTVTQFVRYQEPGMNDDGPDVIAALDERVKPRKKKAKVFC